MAAFGLNGRYFSAETLLCEFTVSKADLLGERALSFVWWVHVVSATDALKLRLI